MKFKHLFKIIYTTGFVVLGSCSSDDDELEIPVSVPDNYIFERDGVSSVSFEGQTTRIVMAEELIASFIDISFTETQIDAMFAHVEGANDFSDPLLNTSDKSVRSKTAASRDFFSANTTEAAEIKTEFDTWIQAQVDEVFPNWGNDASPGVSGAIQEAGGGATRYVNAKGIEYNQVFNKALIGALMTDQTLNNYLGTAVLNEGNNIADNDAEILVEGENYTTMEHKWDEAYGYLYGAATNTANPNPTIGQDDSFLNKYIGKVEEDDDFAGIAKDLYDAFKLGRTAIIAQNYTLRDLQAAVIRNKISEIIAIRAVYYMQQGKNGLEAGVIDYASVFHDLSEGYGFIYSLQFTRNPNTDSPYFTRAEVQGFIDQLLSGTNGLWDVTPETLQTISDAIAARFDFTVAQAGS